MIPGEAYLLFCRRIGCSITTPIDESVKAPTRMVDHSENEKVSPTHDFQEDEEPIDIASEYESDFELKFEPEVPVDSEIKKKHSTGSQKSSAGSKIARKRRSWESKPKEKAQALNDIRMACRICSKDMEVIISRVHGPPTPVSIWDGP